MITQIKTVAVYVEDQAKAEKFFTEKLGFKCALKDSVRAAPNASSP